MVNKIELTKEGAENLEKELRHLIDIDRPEVIEALQAARAQGDLSENADYDAARTKQAEIEGRIKEIENILSNVKIISEKSKSKGVVLGSTVTIKDLSDNSVESYTIVGTVEANPLKGLISNVSPLGRAVIDKNVGDVVSVGNARNDSETLLQSLCKLIGCGFKRSSIETEGYICLSSPLCALVVEELHYLKREVFSPWICV